MRKTRMVWLPMLKKYSSISYRFFSCLTLNNIVTFRSGLEVTQVIQTGTIQKLGCSFLFAFRSNYGRILNRLWDIQRQTIAWPWKIGQRLFKVIENGAVRYTTFYWSAIVNVALPCNFLFSYLTLNNIVSLKSGLEVTQDHSNWYHSKAWVRFPFRLP